MSALSTALRPEPGGHHCYRRQSRVAVAFGFLLALVVLLFTGPAFADSIDITSNVDSNEIELGDSVIYTVEATSKRRSVRHNSAGTRRRSR